MTAAVDQALESFDGTERSTGMLAAPDRYAEMGAALRATTPIAIRGAGLSYCQASAGDGVTTIATRHFDRLRSFDPDRGLLRAESGARLGDVVRFAAAHGWHFPVLPGHPAITLGGCAAFNVHGKTQHDVGHFSDHVESLSLFHPSHGTVECSAADRPDLFELTLGGMGLTGYVAELTIRLRPSPGRSVRRVTRRVRGVVEAVEVMEEARDRADALYSWNDFNRRGARFGRGLVFEEHFEAAARPSRARYRSLSSRSRGRWRVNLSNRLTTELVNAAYYAATARRAVTTSSTVDAAFPINGREAYFALFGRRGFREYQLLLPRATWVESVRDVERVVDAARVPVTLGSLKLFAGAPRLLWFRGDGVCLTIDAAATDGARALFAELDRVAVDWGGLVNLSKDSRLGAATVQALYPEYAEFRQRLHAWDPDRTFDSALRRRIDV